MPLDLYQIVKDQAWRSLWISIGMTIGGVVLSIVGLAAGFIVFFGIILCIAGVVKFFGAMAAISDPTRRLINLGGDEITRRQSFRMVEAEMNQAGADRRQTLDGMAYLSPSFFVYHDKNDMVVARREDVIWVHVIQKKRTRHLRVQVRSGLATEVEVTAAGEQQLLQAMSYAMPHAFYGWSAQVAATPLPALVYEVDRRRGAAMPAYGAMPYGPMGYGPPPAGGYGGGRY
jgi:hypothetical protein